MRGNKNWAELGPTFTRLYEGKRLQIWCNLLTVIVLQTLHRFRTRISQIGSHKATKSGRVTEALDSRSSEAEPKRKVATVKQNYARYDILYLESR